ncbi:response regulator [Desertibaculum subflavum]|uniref:response regulator n=1 Tax=Desertibaculum subflavum TaxID=2268458 RepID=UPI0013C4065C
MQILLVEDEAIIAMDIEMILESAGYGLIITTNTVAAALRKIGEQGFDAALLDLNLGSETTIAVADELVRREIPFLLVTGRDAPSLPEQLRSRPIVRKPYGPGEILRTLGTALQGAGMELN